jgi:hypothetical protein
MKHHLRRGSINADLADLDSNQRRATIMDEGEYVTPQNVKIPFHKQYRIKPND